MFLKDLKLNSAKFLFIALFGKHIVLWSILAISHFISAEVDPFWLYTLMWLWIRYICNNNTRNKRKHFFILSFECVFLSWIIRDISFWRVAESAIISENFPKTFVERNQKNSYVRITMNGTRRKEYRPIKFILLSSLLNNSKHLFWFLFIIFVKYQNVSFADYIF